MSVLFGFGLRMASGSTGDSGGASSPAADTATTTTQSSLLPSGTPGTFPGSGETDGGSGGGAPATAAAEEGDWSPFFIKGGFSFFVGFCIGYALRAFFKISAVALGLVFLVVFGLEYAGLLQVDWDSAGELYDAAIAKLGTEFDSAKAFITGSLPSAGLAGLGLYAGFKRTR